MEFRAGSARVRVTAPRRKELMQAVASRLTARQGFALATLNLDHLVKLSRDPRFATAYARHEMVTADGNPIVWAARLAGQEVELLPGSDLILPLVRLAAEAGVAIGLYGASEASLAAAGAELQRRVPGLRIAAAIAPPMGFDPDGPQARADLAALQAAGVGLCLVALGAPKQERFAALGREVAPQVGFACIGAGLDFLAGSQRRAPDWVRGLAMEWLWRLLSDPRRLFRRYALSAMVLPGHLWRAMRARGQA